MRPSPTVVVVAALIAPLLTLGCAKKPPFKQGGFLDDYSKLQLVDDSTMRYISPDLKNYNAFIVDPIEFTAPATKLSPSDRAEVARYMRAKLIQLLKSHRYQIVDDADVNVARVRIGMTDVANSTWWSRLHPVSGAEGQGIGGASCEGEVIDSVSAEQLAAWIRSSKGKDFNFAALTTVAEVKSAIDKWAYDAARRLDEMKKSAPVGQ